MAYGGPAIAPPAPPGGSKTVRQVKLDKECELRVEVGPNNPLRLRLRNGTAEIYGTEIPPEIWLNFPERVKFAVCKPACIILILSRTNIDGDIDYYGLYMFSYLLTFPVQFSFFFCHCDA